MDLKNFGKRIIVALIAIPVLLYIFVIGDIYFDILIALIAILSVEELIRMQTGKDWKINRWLSRLIYAIILAVGIFRPDFLLISFFSGTLLLFITEVFRKNTNHFSVSAASILNIIYPVLFLLTIVWLRHAETKAYLPQYFVLLIFVSIWVMDTFAYLGGVTLGRHKLIPRVSPNKTIEGGLFGLFGAILTWYVASQIGFCPISLPQTFILGVTIGIVGQVGDLFESMLKRDVNIKDSSSFLPGHGGILDRFDSLLFVSPVIWIITKLW